MIAEQTDKTRMPQRFEIACGQILFDGRDLNLPTGVCVEVLTALIVRFGRVVPHAELHVLSSPSEACIELREAVMRIRRALEEKGVPCHVVTKRGYGYVLC